MRLKEEMRKISVENKLGDIDPKMRSFDIALTDVYRTINTLTIQYRNNDEKLDKALKNFIDAFSELKIATDEARKGSANIADYVRYIRPDYVSVDNATGLTPATALVESVKCDCDNEGTHLYFTIKRG